MAYEAPDWRMKSMIAWQFSYKFHAFANALINCGLEQAGCYGIGTPGETKHLTY
jgi:hypothetical protein